MLDSSCGATTRSPLRVLGCLFVGVAAPACSLDLAVPEASRIRCTADADCPNDLRCVQPIGQCGRPGRLCTEERGGGIVAVTDGNACRLPSGEDGGICLAGACVRSRCGDRFHDAAREACDDPNGRNNDTEADRCRTDCTLPRCGDGTRDSNEECDDGNQSDSDGCLTSCVASTCGDGEVHDGVEECDDGNGNANDGCLPSCRWNTCNDGALHFGVETCEDLNDNPNDGCDACRETAWDVVDYFGLGPFGDTTRTSFPVARGVAVDPFGAYYVATRNDGVVWRVDPASGSVVRVAGSLDPSAPSRDGGPAENTHIDTIEDIAVDARGDLYIAAFGDARVRRVDRATGLIDTVVGTGQASSGTADCDGQHALAVSLAGPVALAFDEDGNSYVADRTSTGTGSICRIDAQSGAATRVMYIDWPGGIGLLSNGVVVASILSPPQIVASTSFGTVVLANQDASTCSGTDACGDGGSPLDADMANPHGIVVDADDAIYVTDPQLYRVRRISGLTLGLGTVSAASAVIETIAGTGTYCSDPSGVCGAGGPAVDAPIGDAFSILVEPTGAVVMAGNGQVLRRLNPNGLGGYNVEILAGAIEGERLPEGASATVVPFLDEASWRLGGDGVLYYNANIKSQIFAVDADGDFIHVAGTYRCADTSALCGDGGLASEAQLGEVYDLAVLADGAIFLAEGGELPGNGARIRRIDGATGIIETVAGNGSECAGFQLPACGDGGLAVDAAMRRWATALAVLPDGSVAFLDVDINDAGRIRRFTVGGTIDTVAGSDAPMTPIPSDGADPTGVRLDLLERLLLATNSGSLLFINRARRTDPPILWRIRDSELELVLDGRSTSFCCAVDADTDDAVTYFDSDVRQVLWSDGVSRPVVLAGAAAGSGSPFDGVDAMSWAMPAAASYLWTTAGGDLYIDADHRARFASTATGIVETVIGAVDPLGDGPFEVAMLGTPETIAPGPLADTWLVADGTSGRVRMVDLAQRRVRSVLGYENGQPPPGPQRARFAAPLGYAGGIACNHASSPFQCWVSDADDHVIYLLTATVPDDVIEWQVERFAGGAGMPGNSDGPRLTALFDGPMGLAFDPLVDTLYVADAGNRRVRAIAADEVTTVAGSGLAGLDLAVDDAPIDALTARFGELSALAVAADGSLYVADALNHQVRRWIPAAGTLEPVLGTGFPGALDDGAPAWTRSADSPRGLAVDGHGNLFVGARQTVRLVAAGNDGVANSDDTVATVYSFPPRVDLPSTVTHCLSGVGVSGATDGTVVAVDRCLGFFVLLGRVSL